MKKKKIVFTVIFTLCFFSLIAIDHNGTINTETWTSADNPHHITGSVTVTNGETLTIEAGCEIKFNGNYYLDVQGTLIADGTLSNHIIFTSNQTTPTPGYWQNIYFNNADAGSILNYCDISYGGSSNGIIYDVNSGYNVSISNCIIEESGTTGIYVGYATAPSISNCTIQNNMSYGIFSTIYGTPIISDCTVQDNAGNAIRVYANCVEDITGTMNITGNGNNTINVDGAAVNTGTWLNHNVPYVIRNNVTVTNGETLTIESGCEIKFNGNYRLDVQGTLIADGTSSNHISFTSNQTTPTPGYWQFIYFNAADAGSVLNYCDISYGGSSNGIIYDVNSGYNVSISNCTIEESGTTGIYVHYATAPSISNCAIQNNMSYGIFSTIYGTPFISDCTVQDNAGNAIRVYANCIEDITGTMNITGNGNNTINVDGAAVNTGTWLNHNVPYVIRNNVTVTNGETLTIELGCEIKFNGNYRLDVQGTLIADGSSSNHISFTSNQTTPTPGNWQNIYFNNADAGCVLNYCDISYAGSSYGNIYDVNSSNHVSISNCTIEESGNAGVYVCISSAPSIKNCVISNNLTHGIHIMDGSVPTFGNNINEWNDIFNNGGYNLYNGTSDIDAGYVYWGTTNSNEIDTGIYDDNDNASLGIVNYIPWTNSTHNVSYDLLTPTNVTISISAGSVHINWDTVPTATSYTVYSDSNPYGTFQTIEYTGSSLNCSLPIPLGDMKFYRVTASN